MLLEEAYYRQKTLIEMRNIAGTNGVSDLYDEIDGSLRTLEENIDENYAFSRLFTSYKKMKETKGKYISVGGSSFGNLEKYVEILIENGFSEFVYSVTTCSWAEDLLRLVEHGYKLGDVVVVNEPTYRYIREVGILVTIPRKE